jgi:hypothetical protein
MMRRRTLKRTFAEATSSKTSRRAGRKSFVSVEALAVEPYPELE